MNQCKRDKTRNLEISERKKREKKETRNKKQRNSEPHDETKQRATHRASPLSKASVKESRKLMTKEKPQINETADPKCISINQSVNNHTNNTEEELKNEKKKAVDVPD